MLLLLQVRIKDGRLSKLPPPDKIRKDALEFLHVFLVGNQKDNEMWVTLWDNPDLPGEAKSLYRRLDRDGLDGSMPDPIFCPKPVAAGKADFCALEDYLLEQYAARAAPPHTHTRP